MIAINCLSRLAPSVPTLIIYISCRWHLQLTRQHAGIHLYWRRRLHPCLHLSPSQFTHKMYSIFPRVIALLLLFQIGRLFSGRSLFGWHIWTSLDMFMLAQNMRSTWTIPAHQEASICSCSTTRQFYHTE